MAVVSLNCGQQHKYEMQKGAVIPGTLTVFVFVCPQSFQSERSDRKPEAELWRAGFHRRHHQHPHTTRQHAWRESPPVACSHTRHPPQHSGHHLHPGQCQNFLLITSGQTFGPRALHRCDLSTFSFNLLALPAEIDLTDSLCPAGFLLFFCFLVFWTLRKELNRR